MPLSRSQKQELVGAYEQGLGEAPHVFLLGYKGISVPQVTELRSKVREVGAHYVVVKNRLAKRAISGKPLHALEGELRGPTAVAYSEDDPVALAKALTDFAKTAPMLEFKGGLLNGQQVAAEQIKDIANLPSREELIAKLLFLLQSPISRFARTLAAIPRDFVVVLDQISKQKQG
jgi:large subunit ribosomal protein L10